MHNRRTGGGQEHFHLNAIPFFDVAKIHLMNRINYERITWKRAHQNVKMKYGFGGVYGKAEKG
jgi:hypothetical protein